MPAGGRRHRDEAARLHRVLRELIEAERLSAPAPSRLVREADDDEPGGDPIEEFRFDLEVMLDGIEALIAR